MKNLTLSTGANSATVLSYFDDSHGLSFLVVALFHDHSCIASLCLSGNNNAPTSYLPRVVLVKFKISLKFDQVVSRSSLSSGIFACQVRQKDRVQRVRVRNSDSLMYEHIVRIEMETKWIKNYPFQPSSYTYFILTAQMAE